MADPLSISASITAVLQLTRTVAQYLNDAKGASQDHQRILAEISSTSGVLFILKDLAERAQWEDGWSVTIKSLNLPRGPLDKFKMILEELAWKLKPVQGAKKVGRALIWPFQKGEINEILSSLERQKTLFNLALQNDHMYVADHTYSRTRKYLILTVDYLGPSKLMLQACTIKLTRSIENLLKLSSIKQVEYIISFPKILLL
jgi:hypothetical protein